MNPEIQMPKTSFNYKQESTLTNAQANLSAGLSILAQTINKISKKDSYKELSRQDLFKTLNECMTLMTDTHKNISYARRMNVRSLLNPN